MENLKTVDLNILKELRGTLDIRRAARKLGLCDSTMYYHFNALKKRGLITGYNVAFKTGDVKGEHLFVLISLTSLKKNETKKLFELFKGYSDIISDVYSVSGGWDYLLLIAGQKDRITNFITKALHSLKNIKRTYSMLALNQNEI